MPRATRNSRIVEQLPLQGHQVGVGYFEQSPSAAALGRQLVAVVLAAEVRAGLPRGRLGQPPHAGVEYPQPPTQRGRVGTARHLASVQAERRRVHAARLVQQVAAHARLAVC